MSLPLRVSGAHPAVASFGSHAGSGSCTGTLGPWVMGGKQGWSSATGALRLVTGPTGLEVTAGGGRLWGRVPRFAWYHPSMVALASSFKLRRAGQVLRVTGRGHLTPTFKSPDASSFTIAGTAAVRLTPGRSHGRLTLVFAVTTTTERSH